MAYTNRIDPELRKGAWHIPFNGMTALMGNRFLASFAQRFKPPKGVTMQTVTVAGHQHEELPVLIMSPAEAEPSLPAIIYLHGGGFAYKAAPYHLLLACRYASEVGCQVFVPDYHLAPRYPYPAAYEDALALYRHVTDHETALGLSEGVIGLGGDSAGASLAALVCNRHQIEGLVRPRFQMLVYPVADIAMTTYSMGRYTDTPLWDARKNGRMWRAYCRGLNETERLAASPMHCELPDDLPDTYIETAELDCLHDEGVLYARRLREAGVQVTLNDTTGTYHGYDQTLDASVVRRNVGRRVSFMRQALEL